MKFLIDVMIFIENLLLVDFLEVFGLYFNVDITYVNL